MGFLDAQIAPGWVGVVVFVYVWMCLGVIFMRDGKASAAFTMPGAICMYLIVRSFPTNGHYDGFSWYRVAVWALLLSFIGSIIVGGLYRRRCRLGHRRFKRRLMR